MAEDCRTGLPAGPGDDGPGAIPGALVLLLIERDGGETERILAVEAFAHPDLGPVYRPVDEADQRRFVPEVAQPHLPAREVTAQLGQLARAARRAALAEAAARAERLRAVEGREPAEWQERHSPTDPVEIRDPLRRHRLLARPRRRRRDADFWDRLAVDEAWAAERIARGFELTGGSLHARALRLPMAADGPREAPVDGQASAEDRAIGEARCLDMYRRWVRACRDGGTPPAAVLGVIVFGDPVRHFERVVRCRNGAGLERVVGALRQYVALARPSTEELERMVAEWVQA